MNTFCQNGLNNKNNKLSFNNEIITIVRLSINLAAKHALSLYK